MFLSMEVEDSRNQTPAGRAQQVAEQMGELISQNLQGIQGQMLKPMLKNYLGMLSTALTDEKALEVCGVLQSAAAYVMYGPIEKVAGICD